MNLYTFNFFVELLLQIALLVFGTTLVVADRDPKFQPARYLVRAANTLLVLLVLVFTVRGLTRTWHNLDAHQTALGLAFSIWLPLVVLPFVWTLAILMSYQTVLRQLRSPVFGLNAPRRTQVALIAALGADLRSVNDLPMSPADMRAIATAGTWRGVREAVRVYRRRRERRRAEAGIAAQRLARFAGVKGVDTEGRQRDQREIAETKAALTWLATCHMGHYRSRGAYRTDLLQILGDFDRQGLPKNHGIEMVVASNGASWYAWRRTPSGLILGVGAAGAPPDQWFFAATDPPAASPSRDQRWEQWASSSPDWHG